MIARAHVDDEIAGELLGALSRREARAVRLHLRRCARCREVRAGQREVLAALADDAGEMMPRPAARRALLAAASLQPHVPAPEVRPRSWVPFRMDTSSSNPLLRWASLWMALAFIVGLVGGVTGWALLLGDRSNPPPGELDRDTVETLLGSRQIVTAEGVYNGTAVHGVVGLQTSGSGIFVATDLPAASTGTAYRLWLFANGTAHLAGSYAPDADGDLVARLGVDLRAYDRIELDAAQPGARSRGTAVLTAALP